MIRVRSPLEAARREWSRSNRDYVARGEEFYRKAAEEIVAARGEGATWTEIGDFLDRSDEWCRKVASWHETPAKTTKSTTLPFSEPAGQVATRHTRAVLRDSTPEQVEEIVASLPPDTSATRRNATSHSSGGGRMIRVCGLDPHTFRASCETAPGLRAGGLVAVLGGLRAEGRPS